MPNKEISHDGVIEEDQEAVTAWLSTYWPWLLIGYAGLLFCAYALFKVGGDADAP